ncbi:MAG: DUF3368 domain-containing protein [Chloroflexia bacterium]|nr:DUF3368 domain-containing protein [Chloroflexia bacterium]
MDRGSRARRHAAISPGSGTAGRWRVRGDSPCPRVGGRRDCARRFWLAIVGTAGILLRAKRAGAIAAVRPLLDELLASGLFLGGAVIHEVLEDAGELPYP